MYVLTIFGWRQLKAAGSHRSTLLLSAVFVYSQYLTKARAHKRNGWPYCCQDLQIRETFGFNIDQLDRAVLFLVSVSDVNNGQLSFWKPLFDRQTTDSTR